MAGTTHSIVGVWGWLKHQIEFTLNRYACMRVFSTITYLACVLHRHAMPPALGKMAPELAVSEWVQGMPTSLAQEKDHIVLVEVFQVNCPGCFLHALPEAVSIYNRHRDEGVRVLGIATAFEDFDKNTLENLRALAERGEVVGETKRALSQYGSSGDTLPYKIPFPLGMDTLTRMDGQVDDNKVMAFIRSQLPGFDSEDEARRADIIRRVRAYMLSKKYSAEIFDTYGLQGTPSSILVDRKGMLRDVAFGQTGTTENKVLTLLRED